MSNEILSTSVAFVEICTEEGKGSYSQRVFLRGEESSHHDRLFLCGRGAVRSANSLPTYRAGPKRWSLGCVKFVPALA